MKRTYQTSLAAVCAALIGTTAADAAKMRDVAAQSSCACSSSAKDPDLVRLVRYQNGSPKSKTDLYVARPTASDQDVVRLVRYQPGSPKSKSDLYVVHSSSSQPVMVAPLK